MALNKSAKVAVPEHGTVKKRMGDLLGRRQKCAVVRQDSQVPPGSIERGERAMVVSAYLGGLAGSTEVFSR